MYILHLLTLCVFGGGGGGGGMEEVAVPGIGV